METVELLPKNTDIDLPVNLQKRYNQLMTDYTRQVFRTSYFLKCKLAAYLNLASFEIIYNAFGKPFLKNQSRVYHFSMSHHGKWVVIIYDENRPVGIDLMAKDHSPLTTPLTCDFFSPEEQAYAKDVPAFLKVWMAKEAYSKLLGTGLHEGLCKHNLLPYLQDSGLGYGGINFDYTYFDDYTLCIARTI
jgi:phosphopantetheinyl transferase